jgi:hypothetical protein
MRVLQDPHEGATREVAKEQKSAALFGGSVLQQLQRHGLVSSRGWGGTESRKQQLREEDDVLFF